MSGLWKFAKEGLRPATDEGGGTPTVAIVATVAVANGADLPGLLKQPPNRI